MADFDERGLPWAPQAIESIRTDNLSPWMVWCAAGAIAGLAVLGLYFGVRGSHPAGVTLTLTPGVAVNGAAAASATPAQALPKDQQWSTLNGPTVLPKPAAPTKTAASEESDSDDEASAEPAAASAAAAQAEPAPAVTPTPAPPVSSTPPAPPAPDPGVPNA
jgi:hypothetical protein